MCRGRLSAHIQAHKLLPFGTKPTAACRIMNVAVTNAPLRSLSLSEKEKLEEDDKDSLDTPRIEHEEDDEVRLAMEMALAAAQNPKLSATAIRKLVGETNKQAEIVNEVQKQKEQRKREEREEARKRWMDHKEKAAAWWKGAVSETATQLKDAAAHRAEVLKDQAERRLYADDIKRDETILAMRKKMRVLKKTLKAHRLQGNRVETRHVFKRQRMERKLLQIAEKLSKTQSLLTETNFNVHEYAKAMLRASKKWHKKGTDEELSLEAQLCRNMHQMLTIEKQKAKVKKETREVKKYLQRCKGWLDDKRALCEMHMMTLDATANSMLSLYEDALQRQDKLITKLKDSAEFKDTDLSEVDVSHFDLLPKMAGPGAFLCALRGLPIRDSLHKAKEQMQSTKAAFKSSTDVAKSSKSVKTKHLNSQPELYIETKDDDASISSRLSDPDEPDGVAFGKKSFQDSISEGDEFDFGSDAPWMTTTADLVDVSEEKERSGREQNQLVSTQKLPTSAMANFAVSTPETEETIVHFGGERTTNSKGQEESINSGDAIQEISSETAVETQAGAADFSTDTELLQQDTVEKDVVNHEDTANENPAEYLENHLDSNSLVDSLDEVGDTINNISENPMSISDTTFQRETMEEVLSLGISKDPSSLENFHDERKVAIPEAEVVYPEAGDEPINNSDCKH